MITKQKKELFHNLQKQNSIYGLHDEFNNACQHNHLDIINYIVDMPIFNNKFIEASYPTLGSYGKLNLIEYFLTSPKFNNVNINGWNGSLLRFSCGSGHLDIVKYLLTSPSLREHSDINFNNDEAFIGACVRGDIDIIDFILHSPDLKKHSNIHAQNDLGFKHCCDMKKYNVIEYLLYENDMFLNKDTLSFIQKHIDYKEINNIIQKYELYKKLKLSIDNVEVNANDYKKYYKSKL